MVRQRKLPLYFAFTTAIYLFLLILAVLLMTTVWFSFVLVILLATAIIQPLYMRYHLNRSDKKERERVKSQRQIYHHYYDRWYTPADSTELDYQIERIKKEK